MKINHAEIPVGYKELSRSEITPEDIDGVFQESAEEAQLDEWRSCLDTSLFVVGVEEEQSGKLVGFAMVIGNKRHAQLIDLNVHPGHREKGVGSYIFDRLVELVRGEKIKYVGLTYDKNSPWLKSFYEDHGFKEIDFAMWLEDSLEQYQ